MLVVAQTACPTGAVLCYLLQKSYMNINLAFREKMRKKAAQKRLAASVNGEGAVMVEEKQDGQGVPSVNRKDRTLLAIDIVPCFKDT